MKGRENKEQLVSSVEFETFCHATESVRKVKKALLNLVPENLRRELEDSIAIIPLQGYYRNPIKIVRLKILDKKVAQQTVEMILGGLDDFDARLLMGTLKERLGKGSSLYIRLDKQKAYNGVVRLLSGDDVIRVKISFLPHIRGADRVKYALELLGIKQREKP